MRSSFAVQEQGNARHGSAHAVGFADIEIEHRVEVVALIVDRHAHGEIRANDGATEAFERRYFHLLHGMNHGAEEFSSLPYLNLEIGLLGAGVLPVIFRLRFANGSDAMHSWREVHLTVRSHKETCPVAFQIVSLQGHGAAILQQTLNVSSVIKERKTYVCRGGSGIWILKIAIKVGATLLEIQGREGFQRRNDSRGRLDANHDALVGTESVGCASADTLCAGREERQLEVAVVHASPTPVEVEHSRAVVTVAHKGVTRTERCAGMKHGAPSREFGIDKVFPLTDGKVRLIEKFDVGVVTEIGFQHIGTVRQVS